MMKMEKLPSKKKIGDGLKLKVDKVTNYKSTKKKERDEDRFVEVK